MTTTLRLVLQKFEESERPLSLKQMAQDLDIGTGMLDGMIAHWVRKGKLREVDHGLSQCATCGGAQGCPFIPKNIPRRYELVTGDQPPEHDPPPCACSHCG
jgi:hypothetical protein